MPVGWVGSNGTHNSDWGEKILLIVLLFHGPRDGTTPAVALCGSLPFWLALPLLGMLVWVGPLEVGPDPFVGWGACGCCPAMAAPCGTLAMVGSQGFLCGLGWPIPRHDLSCMAHRCVLPVWTSGSAEPRSWQGQQVLHGPRGGSGSHEGSSDIPQDVQSVGE